MARAPHVMWAGNAACAIVPQADAQLTRRCVIACLGLGGALLSPSSGPLSGRHCPVRVEGRVFPDTGIIGVLRQYVATCIAGRASVKTRRWCQSGRLPLWGPMSGHQGWWFDGLTWLNRPELHTIKWED